MFKCVETFYSNNSILGIKPELLSDFFQPITLIESLINWMSGKKMNNFNAGKGLESDEMV